MSAVKTPRSNAPYKSLRSPSHESTLLATTRATHAGSNERHRTRPRETGCSESSVAAKLDGASTVPRRVGVCPTQP